jgi:hypothetical protein
MGWGMSAADQVDPLDDDRFLSRLPPECLRAGVISFARRFWPLAAGQHE